MYVCFPTRGIGIVNGIEVIHTFCPIGETKGLEKFRDWIYSINKDVKPSKIPPMSDLKEYEIYKEMEFKYKHRRIKKQWFVSPSFPDMQVIDLYLNPNVDDNNEAFSWGRPDIAGLKAVCSAKFHWDCQLIDQTIDPIAERMLNPRVCVLLFNLCLCLFLSSVISNKFTIIYELEES